MNKLSKTSDINYTGVVCISAYLIVYLVYFFYPTFYSRPAMQVFQVVPKGEEIGMDFFSTIDMALSNFFTHYTPLSKLIFLAIAKFNLLNNFYLFSALSLITFFCTYYLLFKILHTRNSIWILFCGLLFITSYPFLFEIERGQWNIIACFLILIASIFSMRNNSVISSALFGLSVSLKLYPLVFLPLLYKKEKNTRLLVKGVLIGFFLMFVFFVKGVSFFKWYLRTLTKYAQIKSTWIGNHSISSFCLYYQMPLVKIISLLIVGLILLFFLYNLLVKNSLNNSYIHLFCILCLAACMIPSVSHDYKLSILGLCIPFLLGIDRGKEMTSYLLLFLIFLGYFSLHYSYENIFMLNTEVLKNRFPILMLMFIFIFFDYLILQKKKLLEDLIVSEI